MTVKTVKQRIKELIEADGKNQRAFCNSIEYSERSLSHFLTGKTKSPRMELVVKIMKYRPEWNWRWIFFGEAPMIYAEKRSDLVVDSIGDAEYIRGDNLVNGLMRQLDYMRQENDKLKERKQVES